MARYYDPANTYTESFNEPGVTTFVFCRIFGDMVTDSVCILRRRIMNSKSGSCCRGCIMNIALDGAVCRAQ